MRLAFSTNAYRRFPFEEAAARISALGYEGLELMADVPHAWPAGLLAGPKRGIRAAMEGNGLVFSNVNAFMMNAIDDFRQPYWYPSFIEPDEGYRRVRIDHTRRALSLCAELGAPHITTEPGGPIAPGQTRAEAVDLFVEVLKPLAEHAEKVGVLLLIEPEPEPAGRDDRPVPGSRRPRERPLDRAELRRRPRLLRGRGHHRGRSAEAGDLTSSITTSRTSPRPGCITT